LANLSWSVADFAVVELTVNSTAAPVVLPALQNPEPEKPEWFESMVPSQVAGGFSASYRFVAALVSTPNAVAVVDNRAARAAPTIETLMNRFIDPLQAWLE
jgi:hypothetical protein